MNKYTYRVYYEWKGPSQTDPFATEKTTTEIETALREFSSELRHRLGDPAAQIQTSEVRTNSTEVELSVTTSGTREDLEAALAPTLSSWRLFGQPSGKIAP